MAHALPSPEGLSSFKRVYPEPREYMPQKSTSQTEKEPSTTESSPYETPEQHHQRMLQWGRDNDLARKEGKLRPLHLMPRLTSMPASYIAPPPSVGDKVYVPTENYLGHGIPDFVGGSAAVAGVAHEASAGQNTCYVSIIERPGYLYSWLFLAPKQLDWQREFRNRKAHAAEL